MAVSLSGIDYLWTRVRWRMHLDERESFNSSRVVRLRRDRFLTTTLFSRATFSVNQFAYELFRYVHDELSLPLLPFCCAYHVSGPTSFGDGSRGL